jgi:hypothetical protein
MAQNFGHEMGSPDLYRPNPENLGYRNFGSSAVRQFVDSAGGANETSCNFNPKKKFPNVLLSPPLRQIFCSKGYLNLLSPLKSIPLSLPLSLLTFAL